VRGRPNLSLDAVLRYAVYSTRSDATQKLVRSFPWIRVTQGLEALRT
jgi:hypothetical protein